MTLEAGRFCFQIWYGTMMLAIVAIFTIISFIFSLLWPLFIKQLFGSKKKYWSSHAGGTHSLLKVSCNWNWKVAKRGQAGPSGAKRGQAGPSGAKQGTVEPNGVSYPFSLSLILYPLFHITYSLSKKIFGTNIFSTQIFFGLHFFDPKLLFNPFFYHIFLDLKKFSDPIIFVKLNNFD